MRLFSLLNVIFLSLLLCSCATQVTIRKNAQFDNLTKTGKTILILPVKGQVTDYSTRATLSAEERKFTSELTGGLKSALEKKGFHVKILGQVQGSPEVTKFIESYEAAYKDLYTPYFLEIYKALDITKKVSCCSEIFYKKYHSDLVMVIDYDAVTHTIDSHNLIRINIRMGIVDTRSRNVVWTTSSMFSRDLFNSVFFSDKTYKGKYEEIINSIVRVTIKQLYADRSYRGIGL